MLKNIAVFCGSSLHSPEKYDAVADHVGRALARQGRTLVYGSGSGGLMGKVAMGAQKEGGYVIAVNVEVFRDYPYTLKTDEYYVIDTMQNRKVTMMQKSDACIAPPGGIGTLDELKNTWIAQEKTPCIFMSAINKTNIEKLRNDIYKMVAEIHAGRYPFNNFLW